MLSTWSKPVRGIIFYDVNYTLILWGPDVLLGLDPLGFIGVWGEWYYTDAFLNPTTGDQYLLDRKDITDALVSAICHLSANVFFFGVGDSLSRAIHCPPHPNVQAGNVPARHA